MATFHVDYLNGSNSNDGSAANPYATVKYALETNSLGSGDEVKVAGGGETTVDSAATFTEANGYNKLATSTDLTTSISVGDIVRIDAPATDFSGWMVAYVSAIDATSITFYEEVYLPGTLASGNWTIKTLDYVVTSTAGTFEEWTNSTVGAGVDIIFGYNSTFTSVIGRTYFRRSGLGGGSTSGVLFRTKFGTSAINGGNTANFVNLGSLQWNEVLRGEFGGSHLGDNILAYMGNSNCLGYLGAIAKKTASATDHGEYYIINWQGSIANMAYAINYESQFNFFGNYHIYSGTKNPSCDQFFANDLTFWNPGQGQNSGNFGETNMARFYTRNVITGHLKFNLIDNGRSGFNKRVILFGAEGGPTSITATLDGFDYLNGGVTTAYFDFFSSAGPEVTRGTIDINLPTGKDLTTMPIGATRDGDGYIQPANVVRDDNYVWVQTDGGYVSVDTTDFDTGDSSKIFYLGDRSSYATEDSKMPLFGFTKLASDPTSFTIRAKADASTNIRLRAMLGYENYNLTGQTSISGATWTDYTLSFTTAVSWDLFPVGAWVPMLFLCTNNDNQTVWIDSVTVNY